MIRLQMKEENIILTEKHKKYWHYCQVKMTKYEYLTGEEIIRSDHRRVIEQANLTHCPLGKVFEKSNKKN